MEDLAAGPGPLLSVRSEAWRSVDPDSVVLRGELTATRDAKGAAVAAAASALDSLKAGLGRLGGTALAASTARHPLTWSTRQVVTFPERDATTRQPTGWTTASLQLGITCRDFTRLADLEDLLGAAPGLQLARTSWAVDPGNPAWAELRAEAVHEAIRKARDYAAALHASLVSVEHVADVGLLGADGGGDPGPRLASAWAAAGGERSASLDPVPQDLVARVEARFRITAVSLEGT